MLIGLFSYFKFARFPRDEEEDDKDTRDPLGGMMRPSSLFDRVSMTALLSLGLLIVVAASSFAAYGFFYLASFIDLIAFDSRTTAMIYSIWTSAGLFMLAIYIQPAAAEFLYPLMGRQLRFWQTQVVAILRNMLLLYTLGEIVRGVHIAGGMWGALALAGIFQLLQCIRFDEDVQSGSTEDKD